MSIKQINLKLAEVFGIETQNLTKFSLLVEPGKFPIIKAEYLVFESPTKCVIKVKEIESIEHANS